MTQFQKRNVAPIIKKVIKKINPQWKASVHSGTGSAWGWIHIKLDRGIIRPNSSMNGMLSFEHERREWSDKAALDQKLVESKIIPALLASGEQNRVYSYTNDMGDEHYELLIDFI